MVDTYSVYVKRYDASDPRLGRHVRHDSRSLNYQVEAEPLSALKSIRHMRHIPILDQGQLGSCTGNAAIGCLGTGPFWDEPVVKGYLSSTDRVADEKVAISVYSEATKLDGYNGTYPPTDTGSDGLSVAKVLKNLGKISGYEHATSLEAVLTALSKQPLIVGTVWKGDMFRPRPDGRIICTGSVEGGHEYELDELDMEHNRVWMDQSWGLWGQNGRGYITFDDLGALLAEDGDCTVFTPISVPAPQPIPQPTPPPKPIDPKIAFMNAYNEFNQAIVKYQAAVIRYTS